jgi:hypothetical protein
MTTMKATQARTRSAGKVIGGTGTQAAMLSVTLPFFVDAILPPAPHPMHSGNILGTLSARSAQLRTRRFGVFRIRAARFGKAEGGRCRTPSWDS